MKILRKINFIRRQLLYLIYPKYIAESMRTRKGKCKMCGCCCHNCFYLDMDTGLCKVHANRPRWCHIDFPIDRFDQVAHGVKDTCGYYWEVKNES